ncbi:hypothetical protein JL720_14374 [Aureococcus anophagefferens]|nr:hypothetical protein JL720_14374 [Aureococcus anophagefferens]
MAAALDYNVAHTVAASSLGVRPDGRGPAHGRAACLRLARDGDGATAEASLGRTRCVGRATCALGAPEPARPSEGPALPPPAASRSAAGRAAVVADADPVPLPLVRAPLAVAVAALPRPGAAAPGAAGGDSAPRGPSKAEARAAAVFALAVDEHGECAALSFSGAAAPRRRGVGAAARPRRAQALLAAELARADAAERTAAAAAPRRRVLGQGLGTAHGSRRARRAVDLHHELEPVSVDAAPRCAVARLALVGVDAAIVVITPSDDSNCANEGYSDITSVSDCEAAIADANADMGLSGYGSPSSVTRSPTGGDKYLFCESSGAASSGGIGVVNPTTDGSKTCEDIGYCTITSLSDCEAAIGEANAAIGASGSGSPSSVSYSFYPTGCYAGCYSSYSGYYCTAYNSHRTLAATDGDKYLICQSGPCPTPPTPLPTPYPTPYPTPLPTPYPTPLPTPHPTPLPTIPAPRRSRRHPPHAGADDRPAVAGAVLRADVDNGFA